MGYGQTWLFRYPAPLNDAAIGAEREYSRQPSYYDLDESSEEEPTATVNREKDVAAFHMIPIASDRILVTTPWALCELEYVEKEKQYALNPIGMTVTKESHSQLDHAMGMSNLPHESALIACDVWNLSTERNALAILYQEPRGSCWLSIQPYDTIAKQSQTYPRQRFEQSDVPFKFVSVNVRNSDSINFHGALIFRRESIVAYGYIGESSDTTSHEASQLTSDEFTSFFPHLYDFDQPVVSYHSIVKDGVRIIAIGCANGILRLYHGKTLHDGFESILGTIQYELDGPISAVNVFNPRISSDGHVNCDVLVSSIIGYAFVYHNPFDKSCTNHFLPESDYFDSILCCLSADIDMDGSPELLLGTFSNALIAYKKSQENVENPWDILTKDRWDFFFFGPVYSIVCQDMNGDGIDEIMIASTDGIHVLEPDCDQVLEKLQSVLGLLKR